MPTVSVANDKLNNKEDLKFEVNEGQILFDELERQDHILPHGCLAGSCGSCRIEIIEGAENLSPQGAVETDTINSIKGNHPGKTIRLSCRAKVLGNIKIKTL